MCVDYDPADEDDLQKPWGARRIKTPDLFAYGETFPGYVAPFLANCLPDEWLPGMFGMVPFWGDPKKLFRSTSNARSETVSSKPSFRNAWKHRQFAIIPVRSIYEPCYETGKPVRWRIERADGSPFAVAGIWERRMEDPGPAHWSFSMLTVNAEQHPLMSRFHKPGAEKRSIVVLEPADYEGWLNARTDAEARSYLRLFDAELMSSAADPIAPRAMKTQDI